MSDLIKCPRCNQSFSEDGYHKNKSRKTGRALYCKECAKELVKQSPSYQTEVRREYEAKRERDRNGWRKRRYGLTEEEFLSMLEQQNYLCAICETRPDQRELAIDHCHETGKVRGLLCMNCNTALGKFKDDVALLQKAISYLLFEQK